MALDQEALVALLGEAGCVAPGEEAAELLLAAAGDGVWLGTAVARRLQGEPLAWICGSAEVDGLRLRIEPGVYVPRRWQTPAVAARAAALLPDGGTAVDLCTGAGTIAALLTRAVPSATVLATELDPVAVRCARSNGVAVVEGDLFDPLPAPLHGAVDVVTAVAPYVPTHALPLLPPDTLAHEPVGALDGGSDGLAVVRRIAVEADRWVHPGSWLVLELGPAQVPAAAAVLCAAGWRDRGIVEDPEGDACGVVAQRRA